MVNKTTTQIDESGLLTGSKIEHIIQSKFLYMFSQFSALIGKRFIHSIRNKSLTLSQILLPIIILVINLFYIKYAVISEVDSTALKIDLNDYDRHYLPLSVVNEDKVDLQFLNTLSAYYKAHLTMHGRHKAVPFDLNNTDILPFCESARGSIEVYLSCLGRTSYIKLNKEHLVAVEMRNISLKRHQRNKVARLTGHFNNQPYHVAPLALNLITNALLKTYTNSTESAINVINHPLPSNMSEVLKAASNKNMNSFRIATGLNFGLSFLVASFSVFLIKEKTSGAKHLQFLNSCNPYVFWLSAFVWDMLNYILSIGFILVILIVSIYNDSYNKESICCLNSLNFILLVN